MLDEVWEWDYYHTIMNSLQWTCSGTNCTWVQGYWNVLHPSPFPLSLHCPSPFHSPFSLPLHPLPLHRWSLGINIILLVFADILYPTVHLGLLLWNVCRREYQTVSLVSIHFTAAEMMWRSLGMRLQCFPMINPQRACAARVTVLGLCVCLLLNISLFTCLFMPQTILTF